MDILSILRTKDSRVNFLKGLIRVSKSDKENDEKEILFYQQAAISMELNSNELDIINEAWASDKIDVHFENSKEKLFFFIQAIQLCWIDGEYTDIERREIREIAKEINITEKSINIIEDWAYEGIVWNRKGEELLILE